MRFHTGRVRRVWFHPSDTTDAGRREISDTLRYHVDEGRSGQSCVVRADPDVASPGNPDSDENTHTLAAVDPLGRRLAESTVPARPAGHGISFSTGGRVRTSHSKR